MHSDRNFLEILTQTNLLDSIPCAIFLKDVNSKFIGCNNFLACLAGYQDSTGMIGKTDYEMPWADNSVNYAEVDQAVIRENFPVENIETIRLAHGEITAKTFKSPFYFNGNVIGLIGGFVDITDLIALKTRAEIANRSKEQFLYNMRHDIRTPFAGISGLSEMLYRNETDPKKQQYLNAIHASSEQLLNYLNEILELTQIEDGEIPVVSHVISLKDTVQNCIDMYLPAMEENQLNFSFDYDTNLPENLYTDEFRLKRIIINLIGNAVKFTPSGSIYLKISLADNECSTDKISVAISVEDTGIGIPKNQQQAVFEKFKRLTPSYQGKYKGSGLGLFSVKTLVEELQGKIFLASKVNKGSTFTCIIPMKKVKSNEVKKTPEKPPQYCFTETCSKLRTPVRILLIEDMPIIQMATASLLEELSCKVDIADNGEQAIKMFKLNHYDVIFVDIGLPGIDGYEVAKRIRSTIPGRNTAILALTAHAADDVNDLCKEAGMDAVLQKPLKINKAKELLNTYVFQKTELNDLNNTPSTRKIIDVKIIDMADSISKQGSAEGVNKYLALFADYLPGCLVTLKGLIMSGDIDTLKKEMHKLKGTLSLVTLPSLQKSVDELSDRIKGKGDQSMLSLLEAVMAQADIFISAQEMGLG